MNLIDTVYRFTGLGDCASTCHLRILPLNDGRRVVICSELPDNHGTSVTNFAEELAGLVCTDYAIDPERLVWIEHYPASTYHRKADWDLVTFAVHLSDGRRSVFEEPTWRPMQAADWQALGLPTPTPETAPSPQKRSVQ
jgi:hypothetical protein